MRNTRLYLAGPMTFKADSDYNYSAFAEAAAELRSCGYVVVSPHEVEHEDKKPGERHYLWYIRYTMMQLLTCDGIAVLDDIQLSSGALMECTIGRTLKMPAYHWMDWIRGEKLIDVVVKSELNISDLNIQLERLKVEIL